MAERDITWLATERDKVSHFTAAGVQRHYLPSLTFRSADEETIRYFPEKLPIGVVDDGRAYIFLYLLTRSTPMEFRLFLERQAELLRSLPAWTIRLLVPRHLAGAVPCHQEAFREHLTQPLPGEIVDELRWYFAACRDGGVDMDDRYYRAQTAFAGPRFRALIPPMADGWRTRSGCRHVPGSGRCRRTSLGGAGVSGAAASVPSSPPLGWHCLSWA